MVELVMVCFSVYVKDIIHVSRCPIHCPFIWSGDVTTISHEQLEQFCYN